MKLDSNTFNSQDKSSCQPPHIGKWFSSYECESPEVNFGEARQPFIFGDLQMSKPRIFDMDFNNKSGADNVEPRQSRKRKMVGTSYENGSSELDNKECLQQDHILEQMNGGTLSLTSEPPDIRNWFSSYVYESPELNSGADLNISLFKVIQRDQQDTGIKQNGEERENNLKHKGTRANEFGVSKKEDLAELIKSPLRSDDQNGLSLTDSFTLPSEPPDIRNWFSSYVYESPPLFTDGELGVSVVPETERQSGNCDEGIFDTTGGKADMTPRCSHSEYDNHLGNCSREGKAKNGCCFPIPSNQIVDETREHYSTIDVNIANIVDETNSPPSRNSRRLFDRKLFTMKLSKADFSGEINAAKPVISVSEVPPIEDSRNNPKYFEGTTISEQVEDTTKRRDKEDEQRNAAKNGFISTKKNRKVMLICEDPNPLQKQQRVSADQGQSSTSTKIQECTITSASKRIAPSNDTNMQHSTELEISGKWKCPQRRKANLGPKLKQLRLEQWVTLE